MKKRILSLALAICMLLSAMPVSHAGILSSGGDDLPMQVEQPVEGGILSLGDAESVAEPVFEEQFQQGILSAGDGEEPQQEPSQSIFADDGETSYVEQPSEGILSITQPEGTDEEPQFQPEDQPGHGLLVVQCGECGYLDNNHAKDCPVIAPAQPVITVPVATDEERKPAIVYSDSYMDTYAQLLSSETLEDFEDTLDLLTDDQQDELFELLTDDEQDALAELEDSLTRQAIADQPQKTTVKKIVTTEQRAAAFDATRRAALKQLGYDLIVDSCGNMVEAVDVPVGGDVTLEIISPAAEPAYQWQILAGDVWEDIPDETASQLQLSCDQVIDLLDVYDTLTVRCAVESEGTVTTTDPVEICVGASDMVFLGAPGMELYADETDFDFSEDIGKLAVFNEAYPDDLYFSVLDCEPSVGWADMVFQKTEFAADALFAITDCKLVEDSFETESGMITQITHWYQVTALNGTSELFEDGYWILQNYLNDEDVLPENVLSLFDEPLNIIEKSGPIGLTTQCGTYLKREIDPATLTIVSDTVTLYDSFDTNVYTVTLPDAAGIQVEVAKEVAFYNGFTLYEYTYEGDNAALRVLAETYKYINAADVDTRTTVTDPDFPSVSVTGKLENGVTLSVDTVTLEEVAAIDPLAVGIPEQYIGMDISLLLDGVACQPADSVTVTMDVSSVAASGEEVLVYHVHENDDDTVTSELLGPFEVAEDGTIRFTMSRFSYVLVFTANHTINNVKAFYPGSLEGSDSTNDQLTFLGVYYDQDNIAHFLLAFASNSTASQAEGKFDHVTVDQNTFYKNNLTGQYSLVNAKFSNLILKDEGGNTIYTSPDANKKGYGGVFDITLGNIQVDNGSFFGVNNKQGGNGWKIGGNMVLDLDYELIKKVAVGTSATDVTFGESVTVDRGEWVIFQIDVNNKGERPLENMIVKDFLPDNIFDLSTVQMSIDGENGAIGNWQPFNQTLFSDYDSEGGFSRKLYIKAQVDSNLPITTDTTYTNTATIDGMNMPTYEDTASVTVKAPQQGTLTVSKAVTSQNPLDPAPDTAFTFTIRSNVATAGPFHYEKSDGTEGSVANGGTFTLKNSESIVFEGFPTGGFTVTETAVGGFTTKVNGSTGTVYNGTMASLGSPVVAFENQFSTRKAALTVTKTVEKVFEQDTPEIPEGGFTFRITIGEDPEQEYTYQIDGNSYTIKSGGTFHLSHGQSAEFTDIPVGTSYSVEEILGDLEDDYDVTVTGNAEGTIPVNGTAVGFLNTYLQHLIFTSLTINKTWDGAECYGQDAIFTVSGGELSGLQVVIPYESDKSNSVTITGLKVGTEYTVTEDGGWSWRFTPENASQSITLAASGNVLNFANKLNSNKIYWFDDSDHKRNLFGKPNN